MLLLAADRVVSVDSLVEAVWSGRPPVTGRTQIAICVAGLRKTFKAAGCHDDAIITAHPGYMLSAAAHRIDARDFSERVASARAAARQDRTVAAADMLGEALALWQGPALAGISSQPVEIEAMQLEEERLAIYEELTALRLRLGQHRVLIGELTIAVREHPLREQGRVHLMLAQYRAGHRAESLQTFRDGRRQFVDELGLEPGPALQSLCDAILRDDPVLAAPSTAAEPAEMSVIPAQLPSNVRFFTGRQAELSALDELLTDQSDSQPIAVGFVSGVAGVGKTSLVVHWAHRVASSFPDGQLFADLCGHNAQSEPTSPSTILDRFLRALDVSSVRIPAEFNERVALYRSVVSGRRMLIVLDNAKKFTQVEPLLPGGGMCRVLVTGRDQLDELVGSYAAVKLRLSTLRESEAAALLGQVVGGDRARAEPASLARLTDLCDRLPLALRIAAARLAAKPHWTISHLVTRLEDQRQRLDELSYGDQQVRGSFELGYRYLDPATAAMYRRLGLLNIPSFAAWAGAALLDTGQTEAENIIEQLVDAHLLEVEGVDPTGDVRYRFQDLLKLYASERAREEDSPAEQRAACGRAIGGWLALAEEAHRREYGGDYTIIHGTAARWRPDRDQVDQLMREPLAWFETERLSIVAVIAQSAQLGMDELAWDLAMTATTLFEARNYLDDWRSSCELALSATRRSGNLRGEAVMLYALGTLETFQQQYELAAGFFAAALSLFGRTAAPYGRALTLRNIALLDRIRGDLLVARERCKEARSAFQSVGDRYAEAHVLGNMAQIELELGNPDAGVQLAREAVRICRDIGTARGEAQSLYRLAEAFFEQERFTEAAETFQQVLRIVRDNGDKLGEAYAARGLGETQLRAGLLEQAEATLLEALDSSRQIPDKFVEARAYLALGWIYLRLRRPHWAQRDFERAGEIFAKLHAPFWQEKVSHAVAVLRAPGG